MDHLIHSFNAGELSPQLEAWPNLDKYASGCRLLQNFLIMPYGGFNRRPGTQFMRPTKYDDRKARMLRFNFSMSTIFILASRYLYCRFWSNGTQVQG